MTPGNYTTQATAYIDELRAENAELREENAGLRQALNRAFSDRDYWLEWRKAVPVDAIARLEKVARYLLARTGRGAGGPAVDDLLSIEGWLLKLEAN